MPALPMGGLAVQTRTAGIALVLKEGAAPSTPLADGFLSNHGELWTTSSLAACAMVPITGETIAFSASLRAQGNRDNVAHVVWLGWEAHDVTRERSIGLRGPGHHGHGDGAKPPFRWI
jgi:hypothetical protein